MTEWTLTKKSVAAIRMLVIGDKEGVLARRSTLVYPTMPTWLEIYKKLMSKLLLYKSLCNNRMPNISGEDMIYV